MLLLSSSSNDMLLCKPNSSCPSTLVSGDIDKLLANFLHPLFFVFINWSFHSPTHHFNLLWLCLICSGLSWGGFFLGCLCLRRLRLFLHECKTLGENCLDERLVLEMAQFTCYFGKMISEERWLFMCGSFTSFATDEFNFPNSTDKCK